VLVAAGAVLGWLTQCALLDAGLAEAIASHRSAALGEIEKAPAVRDTVRSPLERDPASLRDDDGFQRNDCEPGVLPRRSQTHPLVGV
jgi:hypothetical protein